VASFIHQGVLVANNMLFYMEIIILMSWSIWVSRNDHIFQGIQPSIPNCRAIFKKEFSLVIHRAKKKYFPLIEEWLEHQL